MPKRFVVLGCLALQLTACGWLPLLSGCGGGSSPEAKTPAEPAKDAPREEASDFAGEKGGKDDGRLAMAAPPAPPPPPPPGGGATPTPARQLPAAGAGEASAMRAPILIYTAQVSMAVFEVNASLARVEAVARELGGFLAKRDDHSITIRVPAPAFDEAVKRIEAVGDMLHRNIQAEDVTEEFRDLEIRLKSARAVQARLTELLAKAAKVEESIAIERELDRVSGEIERVEGRMKYLRDRAAFSTITVRFEPKPTEQIGAAKVRLPVPWLHDINLGRLLRL